MQAFHQKHTYITNVATGKNVRVWDDGKVDANGGTGPFATWQLHVIGGDVIAFQNQHNGHWLRIEPSGAVNGLGQGGELCHFHALHNPDGTVSLKAGAGLLGFESNGAPRPPSNTGHGPHGSYRITVV